MPKTTDKTHKSSPPASVLSLFLLIDSLVCEAILRVGASGHILDAESIILIQREFSEGRDKLNEFIVMASRLFAPADSDESLKPCACGCLFSLECSPFGSFQEILEFSDRISDKIKVLSEGVLSCETLTPLVIMRLSGLLTDARQRMENPGIDVRLGRIKEAQK